MRRRRFNTGSALYYRFVLPNLKLNSCFYGAVPTCCQVQPPLLLQLRWLAIGYILLSSAPSHTLNTQKDGDNDKLYNDICLLLKLVC